MTRMRRLGRWSLMSAAALILLVVIGIGVTQTAWFRNWVRVQLVVRTTAALDGELRVGTLGGSLWSGVTLDRVEVWHRGERVLSANRIRVRYDPWTLAKRLWIVDDVVIESPVIHLAESPEGWNVSRLIRRSAPDGQPPARVVVRRLRVSGGTVTVTPRAGVPRRVTDVHLDSAFTIDQAVFAIRVASLQAHDAASGWTIRELAGQAEDNFRSFRGDITALAAASRLSGVVSGAMLDGARTIDARLDVAGIDLRRAIGDPQLATDITGRVTARATIPAGAHAPHVTFAFSGPRSSALGYTADAIDATGDVDRDRVTFDARVEGYGARGTVAGTWRLQPARGAARFSGRGTFAGLDPRRLPGTLNVPPITGSLAGRYDVTVHPEGWRAHAILNASTIEGAEIAGGTEARIDVSSGVTHYAAVGRVNRVDPQRFSAPLRVAALTDPRVHGDLNGQFAVVGREGSAATRLLVGRVSLEDSTMSGSRLPAFSAALWWFDRRLTVAANGVIEDLNEHAIGVADASLALTGRVDGWLVVRDLDAAWDDRNLEGDARIVLQESTVRETAIDTATIDVRVTDDVATVRALEVRGPDGSLQVAGALGLRAEAGAPGLTVTAEVPDLAAVGRYLDQPFAGAAVAEATITGSIASPEAAGTVTLRQAAYGDVASALTSTSRFTAAWPERRTDQLTWQTRTEAAFVQLGDTEIQRLTATAGGGMRAITIDAIAEQAARSLGVNGHLTLHPEADELRLQTLALTTGDVAWGLPEGRDATIRYAGGQVAVQNLTLVRGAQHIGISGALQITDPPPGAGPLPTLDVVIREVELADANHALLGTRDLSGRIDGTVSITGTREHPIVNADLQVADGGVEGVPFSLAAAIARYEAHQVTLDARLDHAPGAQLRATGTIPIGAMAAGGLDVTISGGPVDLGLIQAFTTEVDHVRGIATVDLRLTGSTQAPAVDGSLVLSGGAFDVRSTGAQYQDLDAELQFAGSRLSLAQFQIADADGDHLTAAGGFDLSGEAARRAVDVRIRTTHFSVLRNAFGTAELDADLRITGTLPALQVRGLVTLDSGRLEVAEILERTTATPYSTEAQGAPTNDPAPEGPARSSWLDGSDIDVQLRLPDNLVLRGRDLRVSNGGFGIGDMNIVTGGTFDVTMSPGSVIDVEGTLEVVRGSYSFQGRRFDIVRGSDVRFRGGPLGDPHLNIDATREVSGITAQVRLRGTARAPVIDVTSQPPLDQGEVLSLIVFNQPVNALGTGERINLGERAAALAAGAVTSPLADSIARALNLDLVEIQAPTSGDATGTVAVGRQLGSRVFVGLRQQIGRGEASLLSLEYRVNEVLRFVTSVARGTLQAHATRRMDQGGVDLIFVIRY
jgi:autotransporter translocation and assembly factor TamB